MFLILGVIKDYEIFFEIDLKKFQRYGINVSEKLKTEILI